MNFTTISKKAMNHFESIEQFNKYVGIKKPIRPGIDIGKYHDGKIRLSSPPITSDFYRMSIKYDFEDNDLINEKNPEFTPHAYMFFSSPNQIVEWEVPKMWEGYYIQIDRPTIVASKYLFFNFMEYGLHEGLYLTEEEEKQISQLFKQVFEIYHQNNFSKEIILSYCHLIFSFVEHFYKRQFNTKIEFHSKLAKKFISQLNHFYSDGKQSKYGTPSVQFFAESLNVTPNYLGDIVRNITGVAPMEHIHQTIINEAKTLLNQGLYSNSEVAYHLGFEYPNYFSRLFKKVTGISPSEYKKK